MSDRQDVFFNEYHLDAKVVWYGNYITSVPVMALTRTNLNNTNNKFSTTWRVLNLGYFGRPLPPPKKKYYPQ